MAAAYEIAPDVLGRTLVKFSRDGMFPEEDEISAMPIDSSALPAALNVLASAKSDLEGEIRTVSRESAPHVDTWIKNAKALEDDINRSRKLANEIVREAETGNLKTQAIRTGEDRVEFLTNEARYNEQIRVVLVGLKRIQSLLDNAQTLAVEKRILEALHVLENSWKAMSEIPGSSKPRAVQLLDDRAFALRESIHEDFGHVWKSLVNVDEGGRNIRIHKGDQIDTVDMAAAVIIMKAYKELDERVSTFSAVLDKIIIAPRVDIVSGPSVSVIVERDTIRIQDGPAIDRTIKSLFKDLEGVIGFLSDNLPAEFSKALSEKMMPKLCSKIKDTWLDSAVPASLEEMEAFQKAMALVQTFAQTLDSLKWVGSQEFHHWVLDSPKIWLAKRRETSLDEIRILLSSGVGVTRTVERIETQTISRTEGKHIGATDDNNNEWDAAWSDEEEKTSAITEDETTSTRQPLQDAPVRRVTRDDEPENGDQDDDGADAWGWGDEDALTEDPPTIPEVTPTVIKKKALEAVREVTLTEQYTISSMPEPVFRTMAAILDDAATMTQEANERNPVTPAAVGLFALPTLVLAMYRAVSPYYYSLSPGGNMYLYNDAMWLSEQLRNCAAAWNSRDDLGPRARGKVKLDTEIMVMEKFGKRGYGSEMSAQRTVITDLLGGAQNFLQQEGQNVEDDEIAIDSVISHIRNLSSEWKQILSKSACAQAIGSLLSTVAKKIIVDVEDLSSLGADEAFRVANLISKIVKLDDLFLPEDKKLPQIPKTSNYAPDWLKLHFLSEVLQSDLKDVKYLWFDSDLSLYFNAEELIDLIKLSFESNHRTREAIVEIRKKPHPRSGDNAEEDW